MLASVNDKNISYSLKTILPVQIPKSITGNKAGTKKRPSELFKTKHKKYNTKTQIKNKLIAG
jgi:hypothetical protein